MQTKPQPLPFVQLNVVDEFLDEARRDVSALDADALVAPGEPAGRPVARCTTLSMRDPKIPFVERLFVAAGYVGPRGRLIELWKYCGHVADRQHAADQETRQCVERCNEIRRYVHDQLIAIGFDVRPGRLLFEQKG